MHLNEKECQLYYCAQAGGGNYFQGVQYQRGYGFFGDLGRFIKPLAMKAGKYLGKHLLKTGGHVLSDVASGASVKEAARTRFRETSGKIKDDVMQKFQSGRGIKRKRGQKHTQSSSKRSKKAISERDIFS